jgi:putative spermidine/putrescine transport system permease protein
MDRRAALVAPAFLLLLVVFLVPVGFLLSRAFTQPVLGTENFTYLLDRPVYLQVLLNTIIISALAAPVCVLLGYPVAHAMAHSRPRVRRWLIFLVLEPFWTSLLVRTFATMILLQRTGPINAVLLGIGLIAQPLPLLYNFTGVMVGAVQALLPFVIFPIYAVMARIDGSYMQAALTMGATPARAFFRVYVPLTMPGVLTGATLVFVSTLGYFVTPAMLGGPRQLMIAQLIQSQIADFGNWGVAGALSLVLLAGVAAMMILLHATVGLKAAVQ